MATKYKILIDGEEDDEGNAFDTESEADDYALQWESNWHAGGEVLEIRVITHMTLTIAQISK